MASSRNLAVLFAILGILLLYRCEAQSPASSRSSALALDALLQDYAHRALVRPRTGVVYTPDLPANLSDIKVSVIRLRSGSLRSRGLRNFNEFDLPPGFMAMPYTLRLALVYQNLGKLSPVYYPLPGYTYLAPIVGLLAYDAMDLAAENLPELELVSPARQPITIEFANLSVSPPGSTASCVYFHLNGSRQFGNLMPGNLCATNNLGHFSVVVNSTALAPPPPPLIPSQAPPGRTPEAGKEVNSNTWKIVLGVVGGFLAVVLLLFLLFWLRRNKQRGKMTDMVKHSDAGEVLKPQRVGSAQLPVASMVRTRPVLENEYVP